MGTARDPGRPLRWRHGRIELPPPKWAQNRPGPIMFGPDTEPPLIPPPTAVLEVRPIELHAAVRYSRGGKLWNEYVARYHYLGYKTLVGAQIRYPVHASDGTSLAMRGFSTAARRLASTAAGLDGALQHDAGADRDLRLDPALHRRRLPGLRLDPCGHHPGPRALRHEETLRQAEKGHLAAAPAQGLEARLQPVETTVRTGTPERLPRSTV